MEMSKNPGKQEKDDLEAEIWGAIAAFERILEAFPTDRASLEALAHAYEQVGDHSRAQEYTVRLAMVVLEEGDAETARSLLDRIRQVAGTDPAAKSILPRLEELAAAQPPVATPAPVPGGTPEVPARPKPRETIRRTSGIADELTFAWDLLQANELTQEQYAEVVQDLTELSSSEKVSTISLLHVIQDRAVGDLSRVLAFASKKTGLPVISLAGFELSEEATSLVPFEFMVRRGVVVFELLGSEALAAVVNAYDRQLPRELESLTGHKCHLFLALPADFDAAIAKIAKEDDAKAPAKK